MARVEDVTGREGGRETSREENMRHKKGCRTTNMKRVGTGLLLRARGKRQEAMKTEGGLEQVYIQEGGVKVAGRDKLDKTAWADSSWLRRRVKHRRSCTIAIPGLT